ncbi:SBF-domain-containing protein [Coccomyxa subellipsoidea C-169]|uniref:SBF-domain-containing protein n=1 Tax=Coccomyxa subellipsoidea (strain C-169) TaxID=574566 RepID=I0Z1U5_COCSC|nr:SBF-domain-containing protein [Coccomyxa subellipsoidea C-169]EIE24614.1 SBF-domain-containing protein [Coccomyxa subellipsoidea C-169]|eukprot:XP_005649158.1 SBF-domain-containing protein [Coccomyxa subellipsoidea C-169]
MSRSSDALPYAVVVAAALALFVPASFAWFTPPMYAPGLGFLMFAVGVNLKVEAFKEVFKKPQYIAVGAVGQWLVKPLLGLILALTLVPMLGLPNAVGTGLILVSCVSGAQLSNYATFLVHPEQAPLSIVLTALSTAAGVLMTPALALLLLGARIPVDPQGMALSITQIVLPFLTFLSLLDTCACVGASLASNSATARSSTGLTVLLPVVVLHVAAYYFGFRLARSTIAKESIPLARCISLETGMQSSLLGLLLASRFFNDPLVSLPCGISTIFMTLSGFALVVWWKRKAAV